METFSALLGPLSPVVPLAKASDAELWCFIWSASEQAVEQTIETPVIWDAIASRQCDGLSYNVSARVMVTYTSLRFLLWKATKIFALKRLHLSKMCKTKIPYPIYTSSDVCELESDWEEKIPNVKTVAGALFGLWMYRQLTQIHACVIIPINWLNTWRWQFKYNWCEWTALEFHYQ